MTPDKFKNRLTSYIIKELEGESNMELRNFAKAAIVTVEKSIDLANTVTHKFGVRFQSKIKKIFRQIKSNIFIYRCAILRNILEWINFSEYY